MSKIRIDVSKYRYFRLALVLRWFIFADWEKCFKMLNFSLYDQLNTETKIRQGLKNCLARLNYTPARRDDFAFSEEPNRVEIGLLFRSSLCSYY